MNDDGDMQNSLENIHDLLGRLGQDWDRKLFKRLTMCIPDSGWVTPPLYPIFHVGPI